MSASKSSCPTDNISDATKNAVSVSVVIVTYNSSAVLRSCLEGLVHDQIQIIIVDNASTDGSATLASTVNPKARIVVNKANLGFARAVNIGADMALGSYILLLNPDASMMSSDVLRMADHMNAHEDIGALAPLLAHPNGRLAIREGGRSPTIWRIWNHYSGLSRFATSASALQGLYLLDKHVDATDVDLDWVSGAAMMVPTGLWRSINGLSERWFMYAEDIDICLRIRAKRRRVVITPSIIGVHGLGQSTGGGPSTNPAWVLNMFDLYCISISPSRLHNSLWKICMVGGLASRAVAYWLRAQRDSEHQQNWNDESSRFASFALAVARSSASKRVD